MSSQNWRTEVDAVDYFGHQKKRVELEQRRPVVRRAADLVGPGIGGAAIRVTDFNSVLATFNGYYSAEPGALNAPTTDEAFVGSTVSDQWLGGSQTVTGLTTGYEYSRTFSRNISDPTVLSWSAWQSVERVPASAMANTYGTTPTRVVVATVPTLLTPPSITTLGQAGTYSVGETDIFVLRPGVYTGYISMAGLAGIRLSRIDVSWPKEGGTKTLSIGPVANAALSVIVPFTFWSSGSSQEIRVSAAHSETTTQDLTWTDFSITRVGDAT
jgi:hypothetical protein